MGSWLRTLWMVREEMRMWDGRGMGVEDLWGVGDRPSRSRRLVWRCWSRVLFRRGGWLLGCLAMYSTDLYQRMFFFLGPVLFCTTVNGKKYLFTTPLKSCYHLSTHSQWKWRDRTTIFSYYLWAGHCDAEVYSLPLYNREMSIEVVKGVRDIKWSYLKLSR